VQKFSTMDPEHKDNESQKKDPDSCPDPSNVFQSTRIRRFIRSCDEVDRVILGNRFNLLFHISPIFWIIFFYGYQCKK
jgi:hypothetical protein